MRKAVLVVAFSMLLAGCGGPRPETSPLSGWSQTGIASWYGPGFHGRTTASGEQYDMEAMTAAHRELPFGTWVRVENRDNGRTVDVKINDRGPFIRGRIIDLSRAAARAIGMLGPGTAEVRIAVLGPPPAPACGYIQVGAFREEDNARRLADRLEREDAPVRVEEGRDGLVRVLLGPYEAADDARRARERYGGFYLVCS